MAKKRHYKVVMTPEAVALREIRLKKGLSIREVCRRLKKSEAFLRHIETGRSNFPGKVILNELFKLYEITYKVFRHKVVEVRDEQLKMTPRDEVKSMIDRISDEKLELVRSMLSGLIH